MKNKVIIIDSGINIKHQKTKDINIFVGKSFHSSIDENNIVDVLGHGTAVTSIINSINPDIKFYILKIYDSELIADEEILLKALNYILYNNFESSILHMSLGVSYFSDELFDVCKKIYDKGNLIVSAFDNSGSISYPAAFDFVIGVESNNSCIKGTDFLIPNDEIVSVYSKGGIHRVVGIDQEYSIRQGNSISAAYVTGYLTKYLNVNYNKNHALTILENISTYKKNDLNIETKEFFNSHDINLNEKLKKVALFPYNKEITSIVKFSDMLPFAIQGVYSNKFFGNIGKKIKSFDGNYEYSIENISNLKFNEIDTLVIGHLTELENVTKTNIKKMILNRCLENNVNVFSLDSFGLDGYYEQFKKNGLFIVSPVIDINKEKRKIGKLHKIQTPVLGIFGTSSKQGKFTLQLLLRRIFMKNGYDISQISSEPTGILFGIDETIPFGFNSNNKLTDYEFINHLNNVLNKLDKKNSDIIIVGSQSATVTQSFNHLGHFAIKQIEFLMGTMPDAVVLCVNPNDDIDFISRTINTIENIIPTRVIAIVIYPFVYKNGWNLYNGNLEKLNDEQIQYLIKKYKENFDIPCLSIDNEENIFTLFNLIIEHFS